MKMMMKGNAIALDLAIGERLYALARLRIPVPHEPEDPADLRVRREDSREKPDKGRG